MAVVSVGASRVIPKFVEFPTDVLRIILSNVLNFDHHSYVTCLLLCKRILTIANSDPLLPKKLILVQMRFFSQSKRDLRFRVMLPFEDGFTFDYSYAKLCKGFNQILRALEVKEGILRSMKTQEKKSQKKQSPAEKMALQFLQAQNQPDAKDVLNEVEKRYGIFSEKTILVEIVNILSRHDLVLAEKFARSIPPREALEREFQGAALTEVMKVKAKTQPLEAAEQALSLRNLDGTSAFFNVFEIILADNLEKAEEIALTINNDEGHRDEALEKVIHVLVKKDIMKAWSFVFKIADDRVQRSSMLMVLDYASENHAQTYLQFIEEMKAQSSDAVLFSLALIQARSDVKMATQTFSRIQDPWTQKTARLEVLKILSMSSPIEASNECRLLPNDEEHTWYPYRELLCEIAKRIPDTAVPLALNAPPSQDKKQLLEAIIRTVAEKDFAKAREIIKHIADPDLQREELLYLMEFDAKIQDLHVMKVIAEEMRRQGPSLNHAKALESIGNTIKYWVKELPT